MKQHKTQEERELEREAEYAKRAAEKDPQFWEKQREKARDIARFNASEDNSKWVCLSCMGASTFLDGDECVKIMEEEYAKVEDPLSGRSIEDLQHRAEVIRELFVKRRWHNELGAGIVASERDVIIYFRENSKKDSALLGVQVNARKFLDYCKGHAKGDVVNMLKAKYKKKHEDTRE